MTTDALSGASDQVANYERRWWILAVLGVAQLMVILDNTIINIALPTAQHDLHFSNADRQWVVTAYSLAFGSLLLLGGRIGDIFGRKRTLLVGLIGFAGASAVGGASTGFAMLVIARGVQGGFAALLAPSVLALLNTTFTDLNERGRAFGIYGAIAGAGGAIGLLLGGILTTYVSWRWTLFINLFFAAIAVTGTTLWLKNDKGAYRDPIDIPGLLLVTGGLFSLVFGLSHAETTSWTDTYTIGFLVLGVILLLAFALLESRVTFPLLPPRIVRNRTRGGSMLAMFFASAGLFGIFLFLTYYLQEILGFSPIKTGFAFLPLVAGLVVVSQVLPGAATEVRAKVGGSDRFAAGRNRHALAPRGWAREFLLRPRVALVADSRDRTRTRSGTSLQHGDAWFGNKRCGRWVSRAEYHPAGGRLDRSCASKHLGSECYNRVSGRSCTGSEHL